MTAPQRRFSGALARTGDQFTVGARTSKGVFFVLSEQRAASYLTSTELGGAGRPIWGAYVPFDDATAVGETVSWNSLTLIVKRVVAMTLRGNVAARLLILA